MVFSFFASATSSLLPQDHVTPLADDLPIRHHAPDSKWEPKHGSHDTSNAKFALGDMSMLNTFVVDWKGKGEKLATVLHCEWLDGRVAVGRSPCGELFEGLDVQSWFGRKVRLCLCKGLESE